MFPNKQGLTSLPELAGELVKAGYEAPDYRACYTAASSARFPVTRIRGRWYVHPRDYHAVAEAMGLRTADAPPAGVRRIGKTA